MMSLRRGPNQKKNKEKERQDKRKNKEKEKAGYILKRGRK